MKVAERVGLILVALVVVTYLVNKYWRVEDGAKGGVIEQLLFPS